MGICEKKKGEMEEWRGVCLGGFSVVFPSLKHATGGC